MLFHHVQRSAFSKMLNWKNKFSKRSTATFRMQLWHWPVQHRVFCPHCSQPTWSTKATVWWRIRLTHPTSFRWSNWCLLHGPTCKPWKKCAIWWKKLVSLRCLWTKSCPVSPSIVFNTPFWTNALIWWTKRCWALTMSIKWCAMDSVFGKCTIHFPIRFRQIDGLTRIWSNSLVTHSWAPGKRVIWMRLAFETIWHDMAKEFSTYRARFLRWPRSKDRPSIESSKTCWLEYRWMIWKSEKSGEMSDWNPSLD